MTKHNGNKLKKSLGQVFLCNRNMLSRMAAYIRESCTCAPLVIEIGPGSGNLTKALLDKGFEVVAVEIDQRWCGYLSESKHAKLHVVRADFLQFPLHKLVTIQNDNIVLAGNIPYHLTGSILERFILSAFLFRAGYFLLPQPLAKRISALPRTKDRGRLSLLVQTGFKVKHLLKVPASAFKPKPKIDSWFVSLLPIDTYAGADFPWSEYRNFLRLLFRHKRKTLAAVYRLLGWKSLLIEFASKRAEELETKEVLALFSYEYNSSVSVIHR